MVENGKFDVLTLIGVLDGHDDEVGGDDLSGFIGEFSAGFGAKNPQTHEKR